MPMLLQRTHKGENTDSKDDHVFLVLVFYRFFFFKDYKFSGRNVLLAAMLSFSDAEKARGV